MTEFLTRRELREAERKGLIPKNPAPEKSVESVEIHSESLDVGYEENQATESAPSESELEQAKASFSQARAQANESLTLKSSTSAPEAEDINEQSEHIEPIKPDAQVFETALPVGDDSQAQGHQAPPILTRRQMRELERSGKSVTAEVASESQVDATQTSLAETPRGLLAQELTAEVQQELTLPTVAELEVIETSPESIVIEPPEVDLDAPSIEFTGTNLLAEPSTQSIVLDVAPEAIALPIETGEITVTGSISVLAEPATGSITGGLDGYALDSFDQQDAVTGIISTVEPISALEIINDRINVGVVPKSVLRKGWWRPYLMGLIGLLMAIAAILATITIINALGA